ncbi:MAG: hypothetical protein FWG32_07600 [Oscillospiraceae bacterium]|nr:hypothetical protein [Oscillospiraceae bacterium]
MPLSFLEDIYHKIHEDDTDSAETTHFWDEAHEFVEKIIGEQSNVKLENEFYHIIAPYGRAECMTGFRRGIAFALRLFCETMYTQEKNKAAIEKEWMGLYK